MGNLIDIGSPVQDAVVQGSVVQDAVVQGSVVQNLGGCFLLGWGLSYSPDPGCARNKL
jgi:hypothetical protein